MIIDTHCHLYLEDFDADLDTCLQNAIAANVRKIFLPAIDSHTHQRLLALSQRSSPNCELLPMMGLHPCSVKEDAEQELATVQQYLQNGTKYYAIGEIGLDYYWDTTHKEKQVEIFERQIALSIELGLPIVIHSRSSTADCISSVAKYKGKAKGIFHCFSGTEEEARQIKDLGFYMGIGGVVTYKKAGLKEMLPAIGLNNLVLETDAPYLTPVPYRGKRNQPGYLPYVAQAIAEGLQVPITEVEQATTQNALKVFGVQ